MTIRWLAAFLFVGAAQAAGAGEISWAKDWKAAQEEASSSGKLIMVDFYTDWCGWCKRLDKDTYTNEKVIKLSSQLVSLKLDAEKEGKELAQKYNVQGFPTILFLDAKGEIMGRISGYMGPDPFAREIEKIDGAHKEMPKIEAALKANPDDGEANAKLAAILAMRGKQKDAESALAKAEKAKHEGSALARAYNALGDLYQEKEEFDPALELFKKADAAAKNANDQAYAKVSIMYCYLGKGDRPAAKKVAEELAGMKGAPPEYVEMAKNVLKG